MRVIALLSTLVIGCAARSAVSPTPAHVVGTPPEVLPCGAGDALALSDTGELLRGDGTTWSVVSTPSNRPLRGLWGKSCRDVWMVGDGGTIVWSDGRDFWLVPSPVELPLHAVRGTGHDDVWARAVDGTLLHFDGDRFEVAFTPPSAVPPPAQAVALFR